MSHTFTAYGIRASAKEAWETAEHIKQMLGGAEARPA